MESIWVNWFKSNDNNLKESFRTYLGLSLRHWWGSMEWPKVRCCCQELNVWSDQLNFWATSLWNRSTGRKQPSAISTLLLDTHLFIWLFIFAPGAERRGVRVLSRAGNRRWVVGAVLWYNYHSTSVLSTKVAGLCSGNNPGNLTQPCKSPAPRKWIFAKGVKRKILKWEFCAYLTFKLKSKLVNLTLQWSGKNGGWSGSGLRGWLERSTH